MIMILLHKLKNNNNNSIAHRLNLCLCNRTNQRGLCTDDKRAKKIETYCCSVTQTTPYVLLAVRHSLGNQTYYYFYRNIEKKIKT